MNRLLFIMLLVFGLAAIAGCKDKKDANEADDVSNLEDEANTGPADYPQPRRGSDANRNPIRFEVSFVSAYVLPLSQDGKCWDPCTPEAKAKFVDALPSLGSDNPGSAAKALTTAIAAQPGSEKIIEAMPDLYAHIDCGYGNELTTSKTLNMDRLGAKWRNAREEFKMDPQDECAISIWDNDADNDDELLGDFSIKIIQESKNGELVVTASNEEMGQVVLVELFIEQLEGSSVLGGGQTGGQTGGSSQSGDGAQSGGGATGTGQYAVEVIKAEIQPTKSNGQTWDAKIPFVSSGIDPDIAVEVYVNGYQSEKPFMETPIGQEQTYFEWRATGRTDIQSTDYLHFVVWDRDKVDHDLVGECKSASISQIPLGQEITLNNCGQVKYLVFKVTR